jgi:protein-L-isoaspartate(D-aspartate) O-methyltransferase
MVAEQLRARGLHDERVLAAMSVVPREAFVPGHERDAAYADGPVSIGAGQTISQPWVVARMTELLCVSPGDRVLEIGTGSGYQAAVLAAMGCRVTSIERDAWLADGARQRLAELGYGDRVAVRTADGSGGSPDDAPWDGIIVTAGARVVSPALRDQLGDGRRLVIPVGPRDLQELLWIERHGEAFSEQSAGSCRFVPLIGIGGWKP